MAIDTVLQPLSNLKTLTADNLRKVILKYNIIISTNYYTVDTSRYNLVEDKSGYVTVGTSDIADNIQTRGSIVLAYNSKGSKKITSNTLSNKDEMLTIPIETIRSIKVKSLRNFFGNQEDILLKK